MYPVKQSSTAQPLVFLLVSSTDKSTGVTGLSPTVTISKSGGSFASPAGAITEIGSGWYKVAGNATDTNTLGPLILHATGTGADPRDMLFPVVAFDPQLTRYAELGMSAADLDTQLDAILAASGSGGGLTTEQEAALNEIKKILESR